MTNALKKILVISPTPSHPQNAGNRARIYSFLSSLKELKCEIHFCYLDRESASAHIQKGPDKKRMQRTWDFFFQVPDLQPWQLEINAEYIVRMSDRVSLKDKCSITDYISKFYLIFTFLLTKKGMIFIFFRSISCFINLSGRAKSSLRRFIYNVLYYFRKKDYRFYYFLKTKYHSVRNIMREKKFTSTFLKDFFLLNIIKTKNPLDDEKEPPGTYNSDIDALYNDGLDKIIKIMHERHRYSAVITEYVFMSKALLNFNDTVLKIIDTHDVFKDRHLLFSNAGISEAFFSVTREEESKGLERADLVIAIQDDERALFETMTKSHVITLGHKIALSKPVPRIKGRYNILYAGSGNTANIEGIRTFITHIFPGVISSLPDAVLLIAGNVCDHISEAPGCKLLGEINDIRSAYTQADVVINPAVVGTGLKIKNIEALGFSKPMVTTHHSAVGIDPDQNAFFIVNTNEEFSNCIINLLSDDKLYAEMSKNAYRTAREYNRIIDKKLEQIMAIKITGHGQSYDR